jgi:hypothetical protein
VDGLGGHARWQRGPENVLLFAGKVYFGRDEDLV